MPAGHRQPEYGRTAQYGQTFRSVRLRPFEPRDQREARAVLSAGFREHFGDAYDEAGDHDLDDLSAMFSAGLFLVAELDGHIAGTGGLVLHDDGTGEVRRMSTRRDHRRQGVGSAVLDALLEEARARGCRRVVLGTEAVWDDAGSFYRAHGFREYDRPGASIWFELLLTS